MAPVEIGHPSIFPQSGFALPNESYPERYLFLLLAVLIIIRILKTLERHMIEHEFDAYSNINGSRMPTSANRIPDESSSLLYDESTSQPGLHTPAVIFRPNGDPYAAGVSSLVSLMSPMPPPPIYTESLLASKDQSNDICTGPNHPSNMAPPPYTRPRVFVLPPPQPLDLPIPGHDTSD